MSDPTQAAAPAADTAATTETTTAAPVVETTSPAPAAAPAEPSTLLTDEPVDSEKPAEPKPQGEGEEGKDKPKPDDDKDAHAPEEYADFELPEGAKLDDDFTKAFKPLAKELDLPQSKANQLAKLAATESQRLATKFVGDLQSRVDIQAKAWADEVKADPELGGANHEAVMGTAKKALDEFGTPAFKQFLKETRLGSHPEMVRLLHKAGKAISQDSVESGRPGMGTVKADADVFYGNKS